MSHRSTQRYATSAGISRGRLRSECTLGRGDRSRNVLQHELAWTEEDRFWEMLGERGRIMLGMLITTEIKAGS